MDQRHRTKHRKNIQKHTRACRRRGPALLPRPTVPSHTERFCFRHLTPLPLVVPLPQDDPKKLSLVTRPFEICFHLYETTTLGKLHGAYSRQRGVPFHSLRMVYKGKLIAPSQTPKTLKMVDGDFIDMMHKDDKELVEESSKRPSDTAEPDERWICKICFEKDLAVVVMPCRHLCMCRTCTERIISEHEQCPICKGPFEDYFSVFV